MPNALGVVGILASLFPDTAKDMMNGLTVDQVYLWSGVCIIILLLYWVLRLALRPTTTPEQTVAAAPSQVVSHNDHGEMYQASGNMNIFQSHAAAERETHLTVHLVVLEVSGNDLNGHFEVRNLGSTIISILDDRYSSSNAYSMKSSPGPRKIPPNSNILIPIDRLNNFFKDRWVRLEIDYIVDNDSMQKGSEYFRFFVPSVIIPGFSISPSEQGGGTDVVLRNIHEMIDRMEMLRRRTDLNIEVTYD